MDPSFGMRYFGAYVEDTSGGTLWSLTPLVNLEEKLGKPLDNVSGYCHGGDLADLVENMQTVVTSNHTVVLSYDVQWAAKDIISGIYDSEFLADIEATKQVRGSAIVLRLWAEMNGNWATWSVASPTAKVTSVAEWIAAWKKIISLFRTNNANTKFMWCPNAFDEGEYPLEAYFPGASFVDLLGFDGYNWGNPWMTHTEIFSNVYDRLSKLHATLPIWIGETGSVEGDPGQKADWVTNFLEDTTFPRIAETCYVSSKSWAMDTSDSSLEAFKAGIDPVVDTEG